jgi:peptidoglycan/LPS O-acetylase OafA/YrhL
MPNGFRYDINGLRAYAVVLVVLFHFGILGFSAGFIGVDIFFVISGYLMTGIVIKSLDKGNFSIINFYLLN